jgi:hypothetical protein
MKIAIQWPAETHIYGRFPTIPAMSRGRQIDATGRAPDCAYIVADTPETARRLDAALLDCFRAASVNADSRAPIVCRDPASWLTNREIRHAAALAGCVIRPAPTSDAPLRFRLVKTIDGGSTLTRVT